MARSLGIPEAVTFAGTQTEGLERYYRAADIFIMLSKFDTFGMVVLEAMAASLPVIVSSNVGAKDLVIHGGNGFIVEEEMDAGGIADLIGLLLDRELRSRMGQEACRTALANSWDAAA